MTEREPHDPADTDRRILAYLRELRRRSPSTPADREEWDRFFRSLAPLFNRMVRGRCGSEQDREDGVQELWLMLMTRLPDLEYDPRRGRLSDWISVAARHQLADQDRGRRRHPMDQLSPGAADRRAGPEPDPACEFDRNCMQELVRDALAELEGAVSEENYLVVHQHWIEGRDFAVIAAELRLTPKQVRDRHERMLRKLRGLLVRRLAGGWLP